MSRSPRRPPSDPTLIVFANAIRDVLRLDPLPGTTDNAPRLTRHPSYEWPFRRSHDYRTSGERPS